MRINKLSLLLLLIVISFGIVTLYRLFSQQPAYGTNPGQKPAAPQTDPASGKDAAWSKALEGYKHLEDGNTKKAIECFEESLRLNPDSGKVLNAMGKALIADGRPDDALNYLKRSEKKNPGNLENRIETAYIHMIKKDYKLAQKQLDTLPDSIKNDPSVDFARGFIAANQNNFREAVIHYNKAIKKSPENWQYRLNRAFSLIKLRKYNQAEEDARYALSKRPNLITCYLALAEIEWVKGNKHKSIEAYDKAIEIDKQNKPADVYSQYLHRENPKIGRAIVYWDVQEYHKALADLDDVEKCKDNRKSIAYLYKALIYKDMGNTQKALEYARKWDQSPKEDLEHWQSGDLASSEAECYIILKENEKAFNTLKSYNPRSNSSLYDRGLMFEEIGKYKEAIADYNICLNQTTGNREKTEIAKRIGNLRSKLKIQ